jgi:hypothetical protein
MTTSTDSNWNEYYGGEYPVPEFIVNAIWNNYEAVLRKHLEAPRDLVVMELGGANSSMYPRFRRTFPVDEYHIVDNNKLGLDLFQHKTDKGTFLHELDLLQGDVSLGVAADIVFSAGVIEHFVPEETARVVDVHFRLVKPGGLVLISFPTPTRVYWMYRRLLETFRIFPPLFERPIAAKEIQPVLARSGTLLEMYKIWRTGLTQLLTLSRKS